MSVSAAKVSHLQGYGVYQINDLSRTAEQWQGRVIVKCSSKLDISRMFMVTWPDRAYGDDSGNGNYSLGFTF